MRTNFELIIFDCDGVIVDSEPITHRVFGELLAELGLEMPLEEMYERFLGRSLNDIWKAVEVLLGRAVPAELIARYPVERDAALKDEVVAVTGIEAILQKLETPFCMASSGDHVKMQATLGTTGLLHFFDGRLFSVTEVTNAKPAPDVFLYAAEKMAADPSRTAVVEDTVTGVAAGFAAGMTVFGYSALTAADRLKEAGATETFSHMDELPALLHGESIIV